MDRFRITQIIPAPENLYAVFTDGEAPMSVLCLALWTNADGETGVSGMVAFGYEGLGFAEDCENFYVLEVRGDGR